MFNKIFVVFCLVLAMKTFKAWECEVGRNKPTYQTNNLPWDINPSNLSVDGDFNTYSWSSSWNVTTWLRIDLEQEYNITRIVLSNIYGPPSFANEWLSNFYFEISHREVFSFDNLDLYHWRYPIIKSSTLRKTKLGRYVHVFKNYEPLSMAEINIYADLTLASIPANNECEVALGKSASQISTLNNLEARYAVDDKLDTYSKTDYSINNINNWLQVDLFQNYLIVKVVVSTMNNTNDDKNYFRYFAIFVRQTNETTDKVGTAFGSTDTNITYYEASAASASIVFIKSDGEFGRFVTVINQGTTFSKPLVIADLAVFANLDILSTTTTTTSKTTSGSVVSPTNNDITPTNSTTATTIPKTLSGSLTNNDITPTYLTTATSTSKTSSGSVVSLINNAKTSFAFQMTMIFFLRHII